MKDTKKGVRGFRSMFVRSKMRAFRSFAKRHPEKRGSKLLPGRVL